MKVVKNLDTGQNLYFDAKTPYEAMSMLKYYLETMDKSAQNSTINKTESNRFLYLIYKGQTYSTGMM